MSYLKLVVLIFIWILIFFKVLYIRVPVVKSHTRYGLAENLKFLLDSRSICGQQVVGMSVDGQYINLGMEQALKTLYNGMDLQVCWDPMHKAGLVDKHLSQDKAFGWVSSLLAVCQDLYNRFNWGLNYEQFVDAGQDLGEDITNLAKTCETRFANSKHHVFLNVLKNLRTIVKCLQNTQEECRDEGSRERQKASEAASMEGRLMNATTLLQLSAVADVHQS